MSFKIASNVHCRLKKIQYKSGNGAKGFWEGMFLSFQDESGEWLNAAIFNGNDNEKKKATIEAVDHVFTELLDKKTFLNAVQDGRGSFKKYVETMIENAKLYWTKVLFVKTLPDRRNGEAQLARFPRFMSSEPDLKYTQWEEDFIGFVEPEREDKSAKGKSKYKSKAQSESNSKFVAEDDGDDDLPF